MDEVARTFQKTVEGPIVELRAWNESVPQLVQAKVDSSTSRLLEELQRLQAEVREDVPRTVKQHVEELLQSRREPLSHADTSPVAALLETFGGSNSDLTRTVQATRTQHISAMRPPSRGSRQATDGSGCSTDSTRLRRSRTAQQLLAHQQAIVSQLTETFTQLHNSRQQALEAIQEQPNHKLVQMGRCVCDGFPRLGVVDLDRGVLLFASFLVAAVPPAATHDKDTSHKQQQQQSPTFVDSTDRSTPSVGEKRRNKRRLVDAISLD